MDVLSTTTKGWEAAKGAVQNPQLPWFTVKTGARTIPPLTKFSFNVGRRVGRRQGRLEQVGERLAEIGEAIFEIGEVVGVVIASYGPLAARQLGWAEVPKNKRTAPRVAAGAVIGAGAMYFFEPKCGPERREQVLRLVGSAPAQTDGGPAQTATGPAQAATTPAQPT